MIVKAKSGSESLCQTRIVLEHNDVQRLHNALPDEPKFKGEEAVTSALCAGGERKHRH